jgi:hypothetical protein
MQGVNTWMLDIIGSVDRLVFSIRPNTRCGCTLSNVSGYYVDKRNFNSCNKMACMKKSFLSTHDPTCMVCWCVIVHSSPNKRQKETNCSTQYPAGYYKVFCAQIQCTKTPHQTHNGIISREHDDRMLTETCHFRKAQNNLPSVGNTFGDY